MLEVAENLLRKPAAVNIKIARANVKNEFAEGGKYSVVVLHKESAIADEG